LAKAKKVFRGPIFEKSELGRYRGIPLGEVLVAHRKHSLDLLQDAAAALRALLAAG
jgi:hypothetical protein